MPNKKGTGLLMVWCDVPIDREDEFNRWYNGEHIREILGVPGVLDAARYEAVHNGPKHLACYELESPSAVLGDGFAKRQKSKWNETMGPTLIGENFFNPLYEMIYPYALTDEIANSGMAPALHVGRMNIPAERALEWNDWYDTVFVPNFERVPGIIRGRRYKTVRGEDPMYSVVYELEHDMASRSPEWKNQIAADERNAEMMGLITHGYGSPSIYKKTFEL